MTNKVEINPTQWKALYNAVSAASTYVSSASGGSFEMFKELSSASKFMEETLKSSAGGYGELVDAFLEKMKTVSPKEAKEATIKYEARDAKGIRAEAKKRVADGLAVAASLPGFDGFKRWLLDLSRQAATAKTGGVLGLGAKSKIDEKEQAALDELETLLDSIKSTRKIVSAPQSGRGGVSDDLAKAGAEAKVDAFLQKREALFKAELEEQKKFLHTKTHQDLINAAYKAADKLGIAPWVLLRAAGWGHFTDERGKKYDGPAIDEIEGLKPEQKAALKEVLGIK